MKNFRKGKLDQAHIIDWLRELRGSPYVPASDFDVTTVFRARLGNQDDYYFAGVNVENPDHRLSTHGEEGSIAAMVTALGKQAEIVEGWVMGAPSGLKPGSREPLADNKVTCCGKCRQQIAGLAGPDTVIHSVSLNGAVSSTTVGAFLPDAFSFKDFIPELAVGNKNSATPPSANEVETRLTRKAPLSDAEIFNWLKDLESVDYASKTSQAAIVELANGVLVAGTKVEEAAFVSINPIQSAMATATSAFGMQKVRKVWTFASGRDGNELSADAFGPLSLSAIQTLSQFAENTDISIVAFNDRGETDAIKLKDTAQKPPTFAKSFYRRPKV